MQVYDGSSDRAPQLGRLCGSQQPSTINSTGNQLYIKLRTDSSVATGGFLASYSTSNTQTGNNQQQPALTYSNVYAGRTSQNQQTQTDSIAVRPAPSPLIGSPQVVVAHHSDQNLQSKVTATPSVQEGNDNSHMQMALGISE